MSKRCCDDDLYLAFSRRYKSSGMKMKQIIHEQILQSYCWLKTGKSKTQNTKYKQTWYNFCGKKNKLKEGEDIPFT